MTVTNANTIYIYDQVVLFWLFVLLHPSVTPERHSTLQTLQQNRAISESGMVIRHSNSVRVQNIYFCAKVMTWHDSE